MHHAADLDVDAARQQSPALRRVHAARRRIDAEHLVQRIAGKLGIVGLANSSSALRCAGRIDLCGIEMISQPDRGLLESGPALADDEVNSITRKPRPKPSAHHAVEPEAPLGGMALPGERRGVSRRVRRPKVGGSRRAIVIRTAPGICARCRAHRC